MMIHGFFSVIAFGGFAVDGVRISSPCQAWVGSTAAPAADLRAHLSTVVLRPRGSGHAFSGQGDRRRGLVMRSASGRRNSRRLSSDILRSVPMLRDQQEAVDKGQERAALARKKAQEEIAAAAGSIPVVTAVTTATAAAPTVAGARDGSTPVLPPGSTSSVLNIGGGNDGISITVTLTSAEREGTITSVASTMTGDSSRGGTPGAMAAVGSESGNARNKKNRSRRRRGKPRPAAPVARAEAVELLRQAVTRFRAAQISSSSLVSPSSASVHGGGDGSGGGASEGHAAAASAGGGSGTNEAALVEKDPGTVAAEEFAEIAWRCLGSGLPEIALEAYSLYVRAAASGQSPVIPLRQHHPAAPPAGSESSRDNNQIVRAEAETSLIVTAARAHIAMGGVLDGLALLDDAAGLSGSNARARGKWGGDGEAGAGAAILGDNDASVIVEELCVSGGELGLRAALRLKERLAEENRHLSREAKLLLLEALAVATGRDLGVVSETTGRGLTFPGAPSFTEADPAWFDILRANAHRAWDGAATSGGGGGGSGGVGSGWVPIGARFGAGGDPMGVDVVEGKSGAAAAGAEHEEDIDGYGALVPAFGAQVAARMAEELFAEIGSGKEAGRVSTRAQASLLRAVFRSTLSRVRGPAPPVPQSDLTDRTSAAFDEAKVEVALWAAQAAAKKFKIEAPSREMKNTTTGSKRKTVAGNNDSKKPGPSKLSSSSSSTGSTAAVSSINAAAPSITSGGGAVAVENLTAGTKRPDAVESSGRNKKRGAARGGGVDLGAGTGGNAAATAAAPTGDGGFWAASTLLKECLACKYTAGVEEVLEDMKKEGHWARISTFNSLLWYFRQERDAKGALAMLQCLRESKTVVPDKQSFTLAIQACVWSGNCIKETWSVVEEAERAGVSFGSKDLLDARLILVQAVGGDLFEGLEDMVNRGVAPDESTLLGVIEACAERGDTAGALQILEMMRAAREGRRGVCPRPSYRSYLAALGACSRAPTSTTAIAADGDNDGDARLEERQRPEVGRERVGDWQASKRVLGMMWEDEAARKAEGKAAVPGSWSPLLQEALSLGPSNVTMPAVPDAVCYQLAMECCVSRGRTDEALSLLSEMEGRGLSPNEAGLCALIKGFAAGGGGVGGEGSEEEERWRGIERALGVFEELAERFQPPLRASFECAIDACVSHPDGLQSAGKLISRMKEAGHDLASDHYNVLIRGFGDARNLGAALDVFQKMNGDGVAVGGPGGGAGAGAGNKMKSLGYEVDEDTFAALLGACTRSGEMNNVSDAIRFLRMNGVNPPRDILNYLQNDEVESELYDMIFGEKDRKAGKNKQAKSRGRKYGTSALAMQFIGSSLQQRQSSSSSSAASAGEKSGDSGYDYNDYESEKGGVLASRRVDSQHGGSSRRRSSSGTTTTTTTTSKNGQAKPMTFAESVRESMCRLEDKRLASAVEIERTAPHHPVGWVGTYTEVFTHAERKDEALKRKAGEERSRERREKRRQDRAAAAAVVSKGGDATSTATAAAAPDDGAGLKKLGRAAERRRRYFASRRRGRGFRGSGGDGSEDVPPEAEKKSSPPPRRPLLVKVGGSGSMSEEPSPALEAVVAGLRRKGKWRGMGVGSSGARRSSAGSESGKGAGKGGGSGGKGGADGSRGGRIGAAAAAADSSSAENGLT